MQPNDTIDSTNQNSKTANQTVSNPTDLSIGDTAKFCQILFGDSPVSLRLIAEKKSLITKLAELGKKSSDSNSSNSNSSAKLSVLKLTPDTGPFGERLIAAEAHNKKGFAVFYLPNEFSGGYDEGYGSLKYFRAFVIDLDGAPIEPVLECVIKPSIVVESSPGKYQAIWKLQEKVASLKHKATGGVERVASSVECYTVDEYNEISSGLAALFDGDLNVARATQAFRLPGFTHWKREPFVSRIYYINEASETAESGCSWNDLKALLKGNRKLIAEKLSSGAAANSRKTSSSSNALDGEFSFVEAIKIDLEALKMGEVQVSIGQRHSTLLRLCCRLMHEGKSEVAARKAVVRIVEKCFENGTEFLQSSRVSEIDDCLRDAVRYMEIEKEKRKIEVLEEIKKAALLNSGVAGKASAVNLQADLSKQNKDVKSNIEVNSSSNGSNDGGSDGLLLKNQNDSTNSPSESAYNYNYSRGSLVHNRYTESGIAERVIQRFGIWLARIGKRFFCFHPGEKMWLEQTLRPCEIQSLVKLCIGDAVSEADFIKCLCVDEKGQFKPKMKHAATAALLRASTVLGVCRMVMNSSSVNKYSYSDFDAVDRLFLCGSGVVDMMSGELRDAEASDKLLARSSVRFDSDLAFSSVYEERIGKSEWVKFVREVFAENDEPLEMVNFIQELFGYSLSGSISEQKIFCHWGGGANGKSKVLGALSRIVGDYGTVIEPDELSARDGAPIKSFERLGAKVEGKRVALIDDMDVVGSWNEGFVKILTGKSIRARAEYEQSRVIANRCKFHLGLNVCPEPEAENLGLLRRLCIIPYMRTFEASGDKEQELEAMIEREADLIFLWAVEGYRRYRRRGKLVYPAETVRAIADYREEHFTIEGAIEALYGKRVTEADLGGVDAESVDEAFLRSIGATWENLKDIAEDVDRHIGKSSLSRDKGGADSVGRKLKSMGFLSKKKWDRERGNAVKCYLVKLKFDRVEHKNRLFNKI